MTWDELEAIARAEVQARAVRAAPLDYGQQVAWSDCAYGLTNGLSDTHRFSHVDRKDNKEVMVTFCGEEIPDTIRHLPGLKSLDKCRFCEATYHRSEAARYQVSA